MQLFELFSLFMMPKNIPMVNPYVCERRRQQCVGLDTQAYIWAAIQPKGDMMKSKIQTNHLHASKHSSDQLQAKLQMQLDEDANKWQ